VGKNFCCAPKRENWLPFCRSSSSSRSLMCFESLRGSAEYGRLADRRCHGVTRRGADHRIPVETDFRSLVRSNPIDRRRRNRRHRSGQSLRCRSHFRSETHPSNDESGRGVVLAGFLALGPVTPEARVADRPAREATGSCRRTSTESGGRRGRGDPSFW